MACLSSLPPEICVEILHHLPIKSLLDFGLTSKNNHDLHYCSLFSLHLGVFHSKLGGLLNLMEATASNNCLHAIQIVLPKTGCKNQEPIVRMQNRKIQAVLKRYQSIFRNLEIAMWDISEGTATVLAQLRNLRHLSIRLDHPHTRHPAVDRSFWQQSPGSTVWNSLASKPGKTCALGRLRSLNLERTGITDYQLKEILKTNPNLTELRLRKCFTLTEGAFKFLAGSQVGQRLETFHFTMVDDERIDERVLKHIAKLPKLKVTLVQLFHCFAYVLIIGGIVAFFAWMSPHRKRNCGENERDLEDPGFDASR